MPKARWSFSSRNDGSRTRWPLRGFSRRRGVLFRRLSVLSGALGADEDGKRVRIGSRALALLNALVENAGQFVANDVLMAKAWPSTSVEETNLRVQMTILRRLLDDTTREQSHITNAPGRGYAFTSPLARLQQDKVSSTPDPEALHNLPIPLTPLIGRQDVIAAIVDRLGTRRLISVVGPGGIGKTRVATEVSWKIADERGLRVCFVDLAPLASADFVTGAVAAALHLDYSETASPLDQIIKLLRQSEFLLVLDNCEHVVDEGAALAETLLRGVPKLRILATSREPLRAEGEITVRLAGLDAPPGHCRNRGSPISLSVSGRRTVR